MLLLDKPIGLSSNIALQRVRHLLRAEKAGHTGTLDPEATGLLPLCFGEATKFSAHQLDAPKGYRAVLKLGETSSTGDAEGLRQAGLAPVPQDIAAIDAVLHSLLGTQQQRPPMHSALKHQGRPLYDYARAGIDIERPPRQIVIHVLERLECSGDLLTVQVDCSKGTYIRVLAEEIGARLGCGAWLAGLRRNRSGSYRLAEAISLDALAAQDEASRLQLLRPAESLVLDLPLLIIESIQAEALCQGRLPALHQEQILLARQLAALASPAAAPPADSIDAIGSALRIHDPGGRFLGLAQVTMDGRLQALRLMATHRAPLGTQAYPAPN